MLVHGLDAVERDGAIVFRARSGDAVELDGGELAENGDGRSFELARAGMEASAVSVRLRFADVEADQAPGVALSTGSGADEVVDIEAPVSLDRDQAERLANELASELTAQRDRARFAMAAQGLALEAGDVVRLEGVAYHILDVSDGQVVRFDAHRAGPSRALALTPAVLTAPSAPGGLVEPDVVIVDGPPLPGQEDDLRPIVFAFAEPWVGALSLSAGEDETALAMRGAIQRPCAMGRLDTALYPHVSGRWQDTSVWVSLHGSALVTRSEGAVLGGANAALMETADGWELIQFCESELVDVDKYKLTRLLRGQQGSEPAMAAGAAAGSRILFLTGAEQRLDLGSNEFGLERLWTAWREAPGEPGAWSAVLTHAGAGAMMWSPAHLRGVWSGGDLAISWIRRARKAGDPWIAGEPPLEGLERYRVRVLDAGVEKRRWEVGETAARYESAAMADDFPSGGSATIEAAQLGADGLPGAPTRVTVTIP